MNKQTVKEALLLTAAITGLVSGLSAQYVIKKQEETIQEYKRYAKYLEWLGEGLEDIANNPKTDPIENRREVSELIERLKFEAVLEGLDFDFSPKEKHE